MGQHPDEQLMNTEARQLRPAQGLSPYNGQHWFYYTPCLLTYSSASSTRKATPCINILLSLLDKTQRVVTMSPGNSDRLFLSEEGRMRGILNGFQLWGKEVFGE